MGDQLLRQLQGVHLDPGRPSGALDVVWDQLSGVAGPGVKSGNGKGGGGGGQVGGQDVLRVGPDFVDGQAELLRQPTVETWTQCYKTFYGRNFLMLVIS
jgi:hypothetical protein